MKITLFLIKINMQGVQSRPLIMRLPQTVKTNFSFKSGIKKCIPHFVIKLNYSVLT